MSNPDVVIDLGCFKHYKHDSITSLVGVFRPRLLLGLDPLDTTRSFVDRETQVTVLSMAAWSSTGILRLRGDGLSTYVSDELPAPRMTPCIDVAALLDVMRAFGSIVMKVDVEGAEWTLLERMIETGTDRLVAKLLMEWHEDPDRERRTAMKRRLACPVEEWWM